MMIHQLNSAVGQAHLLWPLLNPLATVSILQPPNSWYLYLLVLFFIYHTIHHQTLDLTLQLCQQPATNPVGWCTSPLFHQTSTFQAQLAGSAWLELSLDYQPNHVPRHL